MYRLRIIRLFLVAFVVFLSSCLPGTDVPQQVATHVSSALTQTAVAVIPETATSPSGPTLPSDATSTATPGGSVPADPTLPLYQTLYQSQSLGIQFRYPSAWYRRESDGGVTLTSFDPSNPLHKLEWKYETTSMQFRQKVFITQPTFDAWVEDAREAAQAEGWSIYTEERFPIATQPAARLSLVSGSGGMLNRVLIYELSGRYFEVDIEGNYNNNLGKAVLDSIQASSDEAIKPPDSDTPAAGVCGEAQGDPSTIILGLDVSGMPLAGRCIIMNPAQRIKLINQSVNPIKMRLMAYPIALPAGGELLLDKPAGQYLALGVHSLPVGPELWVKESVAATVPPPIVVYSNSAVGYRLGLPGDWRIDETNSTGKEVIFSPPYAEPFVAYLSISLDFRTIDQIISFYAQNVPDAGREDTIFNGYTAIKYNYTSSRNEYFVPYGNQIFLIASDRPNDGVVQSILMTIQFVASSSITDEATIVDNGKTFNRKVGDNLKLNLDPGYDWSAISVSDTNVIVVTQGIYQAHASGVAALTATGNPKCLNSTPPCGMPSIMFTITVIVQ